MRLRAPVVFLCLLSGAAALTRAADPWDLQPGKSCPDPYYEYYFRGEEALNAKSPDAAKAIDNLRCAANKKKESSPSASSTTGPFQYFPFYQLARAFKLQGDFKAARACLQRELAREIGQSKYAGGFEGLRSEIETRASMADLLAQADRILKWEAPGGEVALGASEKSKQQMAQIRKLKKDLEDPTLGGVQDRSNQLAAQMLDLCKGELQQRSESLKALTADFAGAFTDPKSAPLASPKQCEAPAGTGTAAVESAAGALAACSRGVAQASRQAGRWRCQELKDKRKELQASADLLQKWAKAEPAAPAPSLPDLPGYCRAFESSDASDAQVAEELKNLRQNGSAALADLQNRKKGLETDLDKRRQTFVAKVQAAEALIPKLDAACVEDLGLAPVAKSLQSRRDQLQALRGPQAEPPTGDLLLPEKLIEGELDQLAAKVQAEVQQLLPQPKDCEGVSPASFESLAKFQVNRGNLASIFDSVCKTAREAENQLSDCFKQDTERTEKQVRAYLPLLRGTQPRTGGNCFPESVGALAAVGGPPAATNAKGSWVKKARGAIRTARSCLEAARNDNEKRVSAASGSVKSACDGLKGLAGGAKDLPPGLAGRLTSLEKDLCGSSSGLEAVAGLYKNGADGKSPAAAELKSLLQGSGLAGNVGVEAWQALEGSSDAAFYAEAWKAVRDAAAAPLLDKADASLKSWEPLSKSLSPFLALQGAYAAFQQGRLDDAILTLRSARMGGGLPDAGREGALGHAALAYFLYIKKVALSGRDDARDVTRLLEDDAKQEAGAAVRADAGLRLLPESLFPNKAFRDFYADIARGGS